MTEQPLPVVYCDLHDRWDCLLCDECGHHGDVHINAWFHEPTERAAIFANATCWAENVCFTCLAERAKGKETA